MPIIALAMVTGYPLRDLSASVGHVVAVLALLPPWVLIYLVAGKRGLRDGWPLVGSLGYIAGQYPVAVYLGPYLPGVIGAIVCFGALLLKFLAAGHAARLRRRADRAFRKPGRRRAACRGGRSCRRGCHSSC